MKESYYQEIFEPYVKNIQNIVNDLEKELKIGTKLEIIIKKNKKLEYV